MIRKLSAGLLACALSSAALTAVPVGAAVDDGDFFDPRPQNSWGVDGLDPGSGNFQYFSPIFAIEQIGGTVFAGGKFLEVTNGNESHDQAYLAAFSQETGEWQSGFDPDMTWSVFALESDAANNRLFVGGEFPSVNGDTARAGFAAMNPATGDLDPAFDIELSDWAGAQPRVHALEAADGWLYIAGSFNSIKGSDGVEVKAQRLARVSLASGIVDASWNPTVSGGAVWDIAVDAANDRVLVGGPFRSVNGEATEAFAIVSTESRDLTDYDRGFGLTHFDQPGTDYDFASALAVADDRLIIGGQQHRLVVTDLDLNVIATQQTNGYFAANGGRGGDIQDIVVSGDVAFVACHCWGQIATGGADGVHTGQYTDVRSTFAVGLDDGQVEEWFQPDFSGSSGPWALHVDNDDCLWLGTDATQAGQQAARGLVQLCQARNLVAEGGVTAELSAALDGDSAGVNAIDGDFRTNERSDTSFAVSAAGETPHLDIDLGEQRSIESIIVWARTDAERLGLQNLHVWLSPQPFPTDDWDDLRDASNVVELVKLGDLGARRSLSFNTSTTARYVRVEADFRSVAGGADELHIAEVAVLGSDAAEQAPLVVSSPLQSRERVVLRWLPAEQVEIFRDGVSVGVDADGWFTDLGLSAGTSYAYEVVAVDGRSGTLVVDTVGTPVAEPLALSSTYQSRERVVLRWLPAEQVEIFRDGVSVGVDADGWFTDLGLSAGTSYAYEVVADDGRSDTVTISTNP